MDMVTHVFRRGGDRKHKEHTGTKAPTRGPHPSPHGAIITLTPPSTGIQLARRKQHGPNHYTLKGESIYSHSPLPRVWSRMTFAQRGLMLQSKSCERFPQTASCRLCETCY
ncbi:hypothetical protein Pcinc_024932 [Petrolisthes cinctipes]|uniref:Uncharacterized protein n=1 Tax=Petrolisthes cinctipes TaxID=88211 RepID=A0AAE1F915_PETCI|nr:hypothetical protein Pcinc_024932 [Petrolisthes cinctipes]